MAGINREKKTSKSLIAENRFKKLAKKPSHKKIQTKKKITKLNRLKAKSFN
jgi:hypothetical protein